jgi:hypothetical protein
MKKQQFDTNVPFMINNQPSCLCPTLIPLIVMALPNRLRKKLGGHTEEKKTDGVGGSFGGGRRQQKTRRLPLSNPNTSDCDGSAKSIKKKAGRTHSNDERQKTRRLPLSNPNTSDRDGSAKSIKKKAGRTHTSNDDDTGWWYRKGRRLWLTR